MEQYLTDARAATILPDAQGPLDVVFQRQKLEAMQGSQKTKEPKADEQPKFDMQTGWYGHTPELARLRNDLVSSYAALEMQKAENPGDPEFDPTRTGSKAWQRRQVLENRVAQAFANSTQIGKTMEDFDKARVSGDESFTPEYEQAMAQWSRSREALLEGAPPPDPKRFWDKEKFLSMQRLRVQPSTKAKAGPGGGYLWESSVEQVTPDDIKELARSLDDPNDMAYKEYQSSFDSKPEAERRDIMAKAAVEGLTPVQYMNYIDQLPLTYTKESRDVSGDPNFGSGGFQREALAAQRPVAILKGIHDGNLDLFGPELTAGEIKTSSYLPLLAKGETVRAMTAMEPYVMDQEMIPVGNTLKAIPYRATRVIVGEDGKTFRMVLEADGVDEEGKQLPPKYTKSMGSKEFINNVWRRFSQFNPDVKEEAMTRELKRVGGTFDDTGEVRFEGGENPFDKPIGAEAKQEKKQQKF